MFNILIIILYSHTELGQEVAISSDGNVLAARLLNNINVYMYDRVELKWVSRGNLFQLPNNPGYTMSLSSNGNTLAIGYFDGYDKTGTYFAAGWVKIYAWKASNWIKLGDDISGSQSFTYFGAALSLSFTGNISTISILLYFSI